MPAALLIYIIYILLSGLLRFIAGFVIGTLLLPLYLLTETIGALVRPFVDAAKFLRSATHMSTVKKLLIAPFAFLWYAITPAFSLLFPVAVTIAILLEPLSPATIMLGILPATFGIISVSLGLGQLFRSTQDFLWRCFDTVLDWKTSDELRNDRRHGIPRPSARYRQYQGHPLHNPMPNFFGPQATIQPATGFNYRQSAHQMHIEQGVEDQLRLWQRQYPLNARIQREEFAKIIHYKSSLRPSLRSDRNNPKALAAIRFIERMESEGLTPLKTTLIQVFHVMQKPENRLPGVTDEDIKKEFIESLYNIQRGENLDADGVDRGGVDHPSCDEGSINKLVYGMKPLLKGAEIKYMTSASATLKLKAMAQTRLKEYVATHPVAPDPNGASELDFTDLPEKVQKDIQKAMRTEYTQEFREMPGHNKIFDDFCAGGLPSISVARNAFFAPPPAAANRPTFPADELRQPSV